MFVNKSNAYEKQGRINHDLQYDDLEENVINKFDVTEMKSSTDPVKMLNDIVSMSGWY